MIVSAAAVAVLVVFTHAAPIVRAPSQSMPADALYERAATEPRERVWADDAETTLQAIYAPFPGVGEVTVRCARTLCEVSGPLTDPEIAIAALSAPGLAASVRAVGFAGPGNVQTSTTADVTRFRVYWQRGGSAPAGR